MQGPNCLVLSTEYVYKTKLLLNLSHFMFFWVSSQCHIPAKPEAGRPGGWDARSQELLKTHDSGAVMKWHLTQDFFLATTRQ